jgi:hypothetical protein
VLSKECWIISGSFRLESRLVLKIQCGNSHCVHDGLSSIAAVLQDDCKMLKHPHLTPCCRIAVQLRVTEKELLQAAEEYVKQRIKA